MRRRTTWALGLVALGACALQLAWWAYMPEPNVADEALVAEAARRQRG